MPPTSQAGRRLRHEGGELEVVGVGVVGAVIVVVAVVLKAGLAQEGGLELVHVFADVEVGGEACRDPSARAVRLLALLQDLVPPLATALAVA